MDTGFTIKTHEHLILDSKGQIIFRCKLASMVDRQKMPPNSYWRARSGTWYFRTPEAILIKLDKPSNELCMALLLQGEKLL